MVLQTRTAWALLGESLAVDGGIRVRQVGGRRGKFGGEFEGGLPAHTRIGGERGKCKMGKWLVR